jgi:hypothetical protein
MEAMNPIAITDCVAGLLPVCSVVSMCTAMPGDGACSSVTFNIYWEYRWDSNGMPYRAMIHRKHTETVLELAGMAEEEVEGYANMLAAGFVDSLEPEQANALRSEIELHRFTLRSLPSNG